jgi:hypothetical protein
MSDGAAGGAVDGVTVSTDERVDSAYVALMLAVVELATDNVVTANETLLDPAGTVTLTGTLAALVLLLVRPMTAPPEGAAPLRLTVPWDDAPPVTLLGLSESDDSAALAEGLTVSVANSPVP